MESVLNLFLLSPLADFFNVSNARGVVLLMVTGGGPSGGGAASSVSEGGASVAAAAVAGFIVVGSGDDGGGNVERCGAVVDPLSDTQNGRKHSVVLISSPALLSSGGCCRCTAVTAQ